MALHPEMEGLSPHHILALGVPVGPSPCLPPPQGVWSPFSARLGPAGRAKLATGPRRALCPLGPENSHGPLVAPLLDLPDGACLGNCPFAF